MPVVSDLIDLARPFAPYIVTAVFVGFFVLAAVAIRFRDRAVVRRGFVLVIVGGMSVSLVGLLFAPFVPYTLYSQTAPTEFQTQEIVVADGNGETLLYDGRAAKPMTGPSLNRLAGTLAGSCNRTQVAQLGTFLLEQARSYRGEVRERSPSLFEAIQFPRHNLDFRWTEERLDSIGRFEQIRVYNVTAQASEGGGSLASENETLMLSITTNNVTYANGGAPTCS